MIKKIVAIIIVISSLLSFTMFSALFLVDYTKITNNFISHFKIKPQHIGKVTIHKFPLPYLIIDSIQDEGKIELEQIEIHFSPLSLLIFKPKISKAKILDAKIYLNNKDFNIINHDELISSFIASNAITVNLNITNLNILNDNNQLALNITNCSLFKAKPLSNTSSFKGSIDSNYAFSGSFTNKSNEVDFYLNITTPDYSFKLLEHYKNSKLANGTGEYLIKNLANILYTITPELDATFKRLSPHEEVSIKFNISSNDELVELNNLSINSKSITGKGSLQLSKISKVASKIDLYFPKIDIRANVASDAIDHGTRSGMRFKFADNIINSNIVIDQMLLNDNESLNNINYSANLANGILTIQECSGTISSGGAFKLVGNVTQNSIRSIFEGKIDLTHKDINTLLQTLGYDKATVKRPTPFILSTNLKFTLIDLYLQNLSFKTDTTRITGDIATKFIGTIPHINTSLEFSSLDIASADYPIISPLITFFINLTENMKGNEYLSKFIPIRTIPCIGNFDITINNPTFGDIQLAKTNILLNISPGNIQVSNLNIKHNEDYLLTNLNLSTNTLKPKLSIQIDNGELHGNFLTPTSLLAIRNKLVNDYNLSQISLNIDAYLSKLYQGDLQFENIKLSLENNEDLLKINNLEANLLSGNWQSSISVLLDPLSINLVYAFNSIDLAKLSAILPKSLPSTYGGASINGSISTKGDTLEQLLYNLNIQSNFAIEQTRINNFSIDDAIELINTNDYDITKLQTDITKALSTGQTGVGSMRGTLTLQQGIATLKDVKFNTKYTSGTASVVLNIYNFDIDLTTLLSFYIINSGTQNLNNTDNKNMLTTVGVKASGTLFDLKKSADSVTLQKTLQSIKASSETSNPTMK